MICIAALNPHVASATEGCHSKLLVYTNGSVEFEGSRYSDLGELKIRLIKYKKRNPDCIPAIIADKNIPIQAVGRVVLVFQQAGFLKVGFLTEPSNEPPN
jgi:biopolymer transport protein ExbD